MVSVHGQRHLRSTDRGGRRRLLGFLGWLLPRFHDLWRTRLGYADRDNHGCQLRSNRDGRRQYGGVWYDRLYARSLCRRWQRAFLRPQCQYRSHPLVNLVGFVSQPLSLGLAPGGEWQRLYRRVLLRRLPAGGGPGDEAQCNDGRDSEYL